MERPTSPVRDIEEERVISASRVYPPPLAYDISDYPLQINDVCDHVITREKATVFVINDDEKKEGHRKDAVYWSENISKLVEKEKIEPQLGDVIKIRGKYLPSKWDPYEYKRNIGPEKDFDVSYIYIGDNWLHNNKLKKGGNEHYNYMYIPSRSIISLMNVVLVPPKFYREVFPDVMWRPPINVRKVLERHEDDSSKRIIICGYTFFIRKDNADCYDKKHWSRVFLPSGPNGEIAGPKEIYYWIVHYDTDYAQRNFI